MWILLRHGETNFHREGRYQGAADASELSDAGRQQTLDLSPFLARLPIQACYVSPLRRATQTLDILRPALGAARIRPDEALREVSIGRWEGRLKSEIEKTERQALQLWRSAPHVFTDTDGTRPLVLLYDRIRAFLEEHAATDGTRLVISHDHVNRALLGTLIGLPIAAHSAMPQGVSSVSIVTKSRSTGRFVVRLSSLEHENARSRPLRPATSPRLIVIRSATAEGTSPPGDAGNKDRALSDRGRSQVAALTEIVGQLRPGVVVTTSAKGDRETAAWLPFSEDVPVRVEPRLDEPDCSWPREDAAIDGTRESSPELVMPRGADFKPPIPDGEAASFLQTRVQPVVELLWEQAAEHGTAVVVAQDFVTRAIIGLSLGVDPHLFPAFPMAMGSVSEIRVNSQGTKVLRSHGVLPGRIADRWAAFCEIASS